MEIGIYITANIIYLVRELYLGDRIGSFSLLERWVVATLFVERHFSSALWQLAGDVRRIFVYSCRTRYSAACWSWRCNSARNSQQQRIRFKECTQNLTFYVGGVKRPCGYASARRSYYKMWASLSTSVDPRSGVKIGMNCINLVTVISRYTVPITLIRADMLLTVNGPMVMQYSIHICPHILARAHHPDSWSLSWSSRRLSQISSSQDWQSWWNTLLNLFLLL